MAQEKLLCSMQLVVNLEIPRFTRTLRTHHNRNLNGAFRQSSSATKLVGHLHMVGGHVVSSISV